jgi:hypothetical protein
MTEAKKPSPKPPWRVVLKGEKRELEDIACTLRAGSVRVYGVHGIGFAYLEAEELNQIPSLDQVPEASKVLLRRLLGLRKLRGLIAGEVEPSAIDWTDDNGNKWRYLFASLTIKIVAAERGEKVSHPGGPTPSEMWLEVARKDPRVQAVIQDLGGPIDLPRLRRVFEHIWTEFDCDQNRAVEKMDSSGLIEAVAAKRFLGTVNRSVEAAHSKFKYASYERPLKLEEATKWLFAVVNRWIERKV